MSRDKIVGLVVLAWAVGLIGWAAWRAQQSAPTTDADARNAPDVVMPASKSDAGEGARVKKPPPIVMPASKSDAGGPDLFGDEAPPTQQAPPTKPVIMPGSKSGVLHGLDRDDEGSEGSDAEE